MKRTNIGSLTELRMVLVNLQSVHAVYDGTSRTLYTRTVVIKGESKNDIKNFKSDLKTKTAVGYL